MSFFQISSTEGAPYATTKVFIEIFYFIYDLAIHYAVFDSTASCGRPD